MRILVFTKGTIIMHKNAVDYTREEIVKQVKENEDSVHDYKSYVSIGNAVKRLQTWKNNCFKIFSGVV